jgi:hypothetical protein
MAGHVDKIKKNNIYMSEVPFCLSKIHFNTHLVIFEMDIDKFFKGVSSSSPIICTHRDILNAKSTRIIHHTLNLSLFMLTTSCNTETSYPCSNNKMQ